MYLHRGKDASSNEISFVWTEISFAKNERMSKFQRRCDHFFIVGNFHPSVTKASFISWIWTWEEIVSITTFALMHYMNITWVWMPLSNHTFVASVSKSSIIDMYFEIISSKCLLLSSRSSLVSSRTSYCDTSCNKSGYYQWNWNTTFSIGLSL